MYKTMLIGAALMTAFPATGQVVLYNQDFESPSGFVPNGPDISQQAVNTLYGNQPPGFSFAQQFTVETLRIGGTQAFGTGYLDPAAIGGAYAVGMLSTAQDDLLGLAFNVGAFQFLNLRMNISSIDVDGLGGPFVPTGGAAPMFRFSLYDNPSGADGLGSGTALDSFDVTGLISPAKNTFVWSTALGGLNASGSTNGNVILRMDLLSGGYAAFDNIRIEASNIQAGIPEPATWAMLILGFGLVGTSMRKRAMLKLAAA